MAKINVLDKSVAQLIAAGEVVERPASVVKELVENSIDSGATKITVEIENGGVTYLRVTDNGCGIEKSELKKAFLPHATSKVLTGEDLESIMTMGFRGEALSSICAVSKVTVITSTESDNLGSVYIIEGGEEQNFDDIGCAKGTTITVENLFFNTPARRKFLKKDVTEGNAVANIIEKLAVANKLISFSFIRDSKEIFNTPGNNDMKSAVYSVYGKNFSEGILEIEYMLNGIELSGCITKPSYAKNNRSLQNFFVNNRLVSSKTMTIALEQAFKGSIVKGRFPACVMYLKMSPRVIDINVHPAKTEIRFTNEKNVFDAIYYAVKSALMKDDGIAELNILKDIDDIDPIIEENNNININLNTIPNSTNNNKVNLDIKSKDLHIENYEKDEDDEEGCEYAEPVLTIPKKKPIELKPENKNIFVKFNSELYKSVLEKEERYKKNNVFKFEPREENIAEEPVKQEQIFTSEQEISNRGYQKFIGEIFKTYLIIQRESDILLIDKHAAHERILFEKLKNRDKNNYSQSLLLPIKVTVTKDEYICAMDNIKIFEELGFEIDNFGDNTVILRTIPVEFNLDVAESIFLGALECLMKGIDVSFNDNIDNIYHTMACRAAIKAGDDNLYDECIKLISELEENDEIKYCPHGRPICISIQKRDIEKKFKRIQ